MEWIKLTQQSYMLMLHAVATKVTYLQTPQYCAFEQICDHQFYNFLFTFSDTHILMMAALCSRNM